MHPEIAFVALFTVATAVAILARRARVPYTVALVLAGLLLGTARVFEAPRLTKELLYAVFLPGLIFEAAFALQVKEFLKNKLAIFSLAIPGLMVAIGLTAVILVPTANALHFVDGFTLGMGLVFAALIAATDPIAVVGLFKTLGAPHRLRVLVEGESLLNDGTAIVIFTLIARVVLTGESWSPASAALDFVRVVGMGALIGAAIGYSVSLAIHKIDDAMIEITLTTIAAYGSFVAAEHFHFSGVIATVVAGMFCGNHAARTGMSSSTRIAVAVFWEYLAFALNSIVFLLIGFEVRLATLLAAWKPILAAYLAVMIGRAVVIGLVGLLLGPTRERLPKRWGLVLTWGGLRGGLSMVLVLGLPQSMPHRELVVAMTFGVVILSILIQGPTMGWLLRRLGLVGSDGPGLYERLRARIRTRRAAASDLQQVALEGGHDAALLGQIVERLAASIAEDEAELAKIRPELARQREQTELRRRALSAEKSALVAMHHAGEIGDEVFASIRSELDEELVALGEPHH